MLKLVALAAVLAFPALADGPRPEGDAAPAATPAASPPPSTSPTPASPALINDAKPLFPVGFKAPQAAPKPQQRPAETGGAGALTAMAVPLAVVVGVILIASLLFKRAVKSGGSLASAIGAGGRAPAGLLEVLGRYPVARGQTLVLLKLDQRVLLLSQTQATRGHAGGFATLSEITDPVDVASILSKVGETEATGPASRFNAMLADANGEHDPLPRPTGFRRLAAMINPQPVSWQEPEPPAPTQPEGPEATAPTMRFTGVDSLRSRIAAMKNAGGER
ncbi:MAG TPA: flagellar biosynthetic protein FliO [Phycisphaerales bacterium]|nr:flagellar biosynthetic protein FliO [Phycisphaerales bacterium]